MVDSLALHSRYGYALDDVLLEDGEDDEDGHEGLKDIPNSVLIVLG